MKTTTTTFIVLMAVMPGAAACSRPFNAVTFYEGTRFAMAVEYNPVSGQPANLSLGYKRRIATVVPPQQSAPPQSEADSNPSHSGESRSLVSPVDVGPRSEQVGGGLVIERSFASGMAARDLTRGDAAQKVKGLFAPATLPVLSPETEA